MNGEHKKKIKKIIGQMQCPHDFRCAESGFVNLCKVKDFGLDHYLECLVEDPMRCRFAIPFYDIHLCQCPLRVYLAKKLKK
jgi:hypothetical protein